MTGRVIAECSEKAHSRLFAQGWVMIGNYPLIPVCVGNTNGLKYLQPPGVNFYFQIHVIYGCSVGHQTSSVLFQSFMLSAYWDSVQLFLENTYWTNFLKNEDELSRLIYTYRF